MFSHFQKDVLIYKKERNNRPRRWGFFGSGSVDVSDRFSGTLDESAAVGVAPSQLCSVFEVDVECGSSGSSVLDYALHYLPTQPRGAGHIRPTPGIATHSPRFHVGLISYSPNSLDECRSQPEDEGLIRRRQPEPHGQPVDFIAPPEPNEEDDHAARDRGELRQVLRSPGRNRNRGHKD